MLFVVPIWLRPMSKAQETLLEVEDYDRYMSRLEAAYLKHIGIFVGIDRGQQPNLLILHLPEERLVFNLINKLDVVMWSFMKDENFELLAYINGLEAIIA